MPLIVLTVSRAINTARKTEKIQVLQHNGAKRRSVSTPSLAFTECFPPGLKPHVLLYFVGRGEKSPAVAYQLGCSHASSDELHVISQPSSFQLC